MLLIVLYIDTYKLLNMLIVLLIVVLSHSYIFLYFPHIKFLIMYINLQNLKYINTLLTAILSHIYIYIYMYVFSPYCATTCPVYTCTKPEKY